MCEKTQNRTSLKPYAFISIVDWLSCTLAATIYIKKKISLMKNWSFHGDLYMYEPGFFFKIKTYVLLQLRENGGWYSWHGPLFYVSFDGHCLAEIRTFNDKSYHVSIDLGNRWAVYKTLIMSTDVFLEPQLTDNGK